MTGPPAFVETRRLRLRALTDADMEPFVAMLSDADAMRYVSPMPLSRDAAEAVANHYRRAQERNGYGWWAIEVTGDASFAGIVLLQDVEFSAAFTPAFEIGWLLPQARWGNGYATEGARGALDYAFHVLGREEVVALTAAGNRPSRRVMERLGMSRDPADDFEHPQVSGTALARCVLYRIRHPAP